jgi:hypothetical protein
MAIIKAPFNQEQVDNINEFQTSGMVHEASIILLAFKEGANWQLRTSERNYRNKQNKIARFLSDESNMRGAQRP